MKMYKVGDTVRIRSDLKNFSSFDFPVGLTNSMKECAGRIATITFVQTSDCDSDRIVYKIDINDCWWEDDLFECHYDKLKEYLVNLCLK